MAIRGYEARPRAGSPEPYTGPAEVLEEVSRSVTHQFVSAPQVPANVGHDAPVDGHQSAPSYPRGGLSPCTATRAATRAAASAGSSRFTQGPGPAEVRTPHVRNTGTGSPEVSSGANLTRADLTGAHLTRADLTGAHLAGA